MRRLAFPFEGEPTIKPDELPKKLGRVVIKESVAVTVTPNTGQTGVGVLQGQTGGVAATALEVDNKLPEAISKNLTHSIEEQNLEITSANETVRRAVQIPPGVRVERIKVYGNYRCVRMPMTPNRSQSLLGLARQAAASVGGITINDTAGGTYMPMAFVVHKGDGSQVIKVDHQAPITSLRQIPVREMAPGDSLYLYFMVPKGVVIDKIQMGSQGIGQAVTPPLKVE
jgi:hypothetical protein